MLFYLRISSNISQIMHQYVINNLLCISVLFLTLRQIFFYEENSYSYIFLVNNQFISNS